VKRFQKGGLTLSEILIATVIMVLVSIPVIGLFLTSKQTITRTDTRREKRYFLSEILGRAQKHSLHVLWRYFGPGFVGGMENECGWVRDGIAITDTAGKLLPRPNIVKLQKSQMDPNPLGFTQDFMDDLRVAGYEARVRFEFYRRNKLGVTPAAYAPGEKVRQLAVGELGVHHLQAGVIAIGVRSKDPREDRTPEIWIVPMMCPAIVGRPGLKMEGCPALQDSYTDFDGTTYDFHDRYSSLLAKREAVPEEQDQPLFDDQ
jgi:hypothetical protein